jgi:polyhydroxybutyrate depolymerase
MKMPMPNKLVGAFIFVASIIISSVEDVHAIDRFKSTTSRLDLKEIDVDGVRRSYYIHFPSTKKTDKRLPLVLVLHGGGKGDGRKPARNLGFSKLSDLNGFIVAYPNGIDAYWRDGRGYTHRGNNNNIDDVRYISKLIDHLVRNNKADPNRVYVTGISNGGMMTLRLGAELSSKLAAIAPIAANIPKNIVNTSKPVHPLPVLLMNGTDDPLVPYNGGYVRFFRKRMGEVVSTQETISFWVKHNRCNAVPATRKLPDRDRSDHSRVIVTSYTKPHNRCEEVVLYTIKGGGHTLPGSNTPNLPRVLGWKNNDIDGAKVIWEFLSKYSR